MYQRLYNPAAYLASQRVAMLGWQYEIDELLGGQPRATRFVQALPEDPARAGTTAIVGECAGLFWSDGNTWRAVQGGPKGGWFRLHVTPAERARGDWQPVVAWGPPGRQDAVGVKRTGDLVHVALGRPGTERKPRWYQITAPVRVRSAGFNLDVHVDHVREQVRASVNGESALDMGATGTPKGAVYTVGRARSPGIAPTFEGRIVTRPADRELCESLLERRDD